MGQNQYLSPTHPVYKSHITTERYQHQVVQNSDKQLQNPRSKGNTDMNLMIRREGGVRSMMNDSNIPQGYSQSPSNDPGQINEVQWWRDKYEEQKQQF